MESAEWNANEDLFCSSDVMLRHFLRSTGLFYIFFLEERHGRFIRQSVMCLSFISDECDDSFLLLLSQMLTTLVAFLPIKGELT